MHPVHKKYDRVGADSKCQKCGCIIKGTNTTNLVGHIQKKHRDDDETKKVMEEIDAYKTQRTETSQRPKRRSSAKNQKLDDAFEIKFPSGDKRQRNITEAISSMIIKDAMPFQVHFI